MNRRNSGFTLIELMITVVIMAILVAIAYPSYTRYIARSNRTAAQSYLMDLAQREQQYLLDARTYADDATIKAVDGVPSNVAAQYKIEVKPPTPTTTFEIWATPWPGSIQAVNNEPVLKITNTGDKIPADKWN